MKPYKKAVLIIYFLLWSFLLWHHGQAIGKAKIKEIVRNSDGSSHLKECLDVADRPKYEGKWRYKPC